MGTKLKLYPFQKPIAERLVESLEKFGRAVCPQDPGTGKTYMIAAAAWMLAYRRVFVICPLSVVTAWTQVLSSAGFSKNQIHVTNYERARRGQLPGLRKSGKGFKFQPPPGALVVFDEAHKLKGRMTLQSKLGYAAKQSSAHVVLASATLFSSPLELDAIGYILRLHPGYKGFGQWLEKLGCWRDEWGQWYFPNDPQVLRKLRDFIYSNYATKLNVETIPEFPANNVSVGVYDVPDVSEVARNYEAIEVALADLERRSATDGDLRLTELLRLRQAVELAKVPTLVELAETELEAERSVVVFVCFKATLNAVLEKLADSTRRRIARIEGGQTTAERQENIDRFQANQCEALVSTISAGGVAVSLHDLHGRPRASIISPSWSAVEFVQTLGRIHRVGSKSKAHQRIVMAAGTVEEDVAVALNTKLQNLETLNDTDLTPFRAHHFKQNQNTLNKEKND